MSLVVIITRVSPYFLLTISSDKRRRSIAFTDTSQTVRATSRRGWLQTRRSRLRTLHGIELLVLPETGIAWPTLELSVCFSASRKYNAHSPKWKPQDQVQNVSFQGNIAFANLKMSSNSLRLSLQDPIRCYKWC